MVQNINITVSEENFDDYICITDIAKAKVGESRGADVVKNWMRNRTTLEFLGAWEKVDAYHGKSNMASFNHAMSGAVASCFHKYLVGIRPDEGAPGFSSAVIRPLIPKQLQYASGSIVTQAGKYSCCWKKGEGGSLSVKVEIPFNCAADVYLPVKDNLVWRKQDRKCSGETVCVSEGNFIHMKVQSGIKKFIGSAKE